MSILAKKICYLLPVVKSDVPVLLKHNNLIQCVTINSSRIFHNSKSTCSPIVCVVGSGPAGFGITQYLLKNNDSLQVKMLEKLPVPYGLIRYGVSPDHQDVKNCIHGYERVAENPRFSFHGGVNVGQIVSLQELSKFSDAIVLCNGAQKELGLGIPGEDLKNVFTAKEFVGWYNGVPEYQHIRPNITGETVAIIGVGNVALDCARMLLAPTNTLQSTDITLPSFNTLYRSNIKNVVLIGRRGPLQMTCTRREMSEICDLSSVNTVTDLDCFTPKILDILQTSDTNTQMKYRKSLRLVKYLIKMARAYNKHRRSKKFTIELLQSPLKILDTNGKVDGVLLRKNVMAGKDVFQQEIISTDTEKLVKCSMVITAIGYGNEPLEDSILFSDGKILTTNGRIEHKLPLYACGWCKSGARGVLGDTLNDCLITSKTILNDLETISPKMSVNTIEELFMEKGIKTLSWGDWNVLDKYEIEKGKSAEKIREKILSVEEMFNIANDIRKTADNESAV